MSVQDEPMLDTCSCGSLIETQNWVTHFKGCDAAIKSIEGLANTVRVGIYLECKDSEYALDMLLEIIRKLCK